MALADRQTVRFRGGSVTATSQVDVIPLSGLFQRAGRREARKIGREIVREAKALAPVKTGRLRASIHMNDPRPVGRWRVEARVTAGAPYSKFVHEGTAAHVIRARNAQVLAFRWDKMGGRTVFFKSVQHPGTKANPFLATAARRVAARHR